jgi:hypothetical protein
MKKYIGMLLVLAYLYFLSAGIAMAKDKPALRQSQESVVEPTKEVKAISLEEATDKVVSMVNKYFVPENNATLLRKSVEESGLYKVNLSVNNNTQDFYLTKDGALLVLPGGFIDIAKFEEATKKQQETQKEEIPKTQRPTVELFVMSLCPYGIKAEKEILPVIKLFGDKIDFKVKYIVKVKGSTINEVVSMHGNNEAMEDARQAAIMKYYPDKLQPYIEKIDKNSCVISCGAVKLEDYWKMAAKELRIDVKKIESFTYGQEGISLLKQNETDSEKYEINASPTLVINGIKSRAIYQGAKAVEQAIYSAFTNSLDVRQENK